MKLYLPALLFISSLVNAQTSKLSAPEVTRNPQIVTNTKTYGYVGGVRLDSIDAKYASFRRRALSDAWVFDFGQTGGRNELLISDCKGNPLDFVPDSTPFLLNFFYFNGWQLDQAYHSTSSGDKDGIDKFILKKL